MTTLSILKLISQISVKLVLLLKWLSGIKNIEQDLELAKIMADNGQYVECRAILVSLENKLSLKISKENKIRILNLKAFCDINTKGNEKRGLGLVVHALKLNGKGNREFINSLTLLINAMCNEDNRIDWAGEAKIWLDKANGRLDEYNEKEREKLNSLNMMYYAILARFNGNVKNSERANHRLDMVCLDEHPVDVRDIINSATVRISSNDPNLSDEFYDDAIHTYLRALDLLNYDNDSELILLTKFNLAVAYAQRFESSMSVGIKNELIKESIKYFNDAIELAHKLGDLSKINSIAIEYADLYRAMYQASNKREFAQKSIDEFNKLINKTNEFRLDAYIKMKRGFLFFLIAVNEVDEKWGEMALSDLNSAIEYFKNDRYPDQNAILNNNIGKIYHWFLLQTRDETYRHCAIIHLNKAIDTYQKQGDVNYCEILKARIGEIEMAANNR